MSGWLQLAIALGALGCVVGAYFLMPRKHKPRVLPPPRSAGLARSYQETNSVASLFLDVLKLKEGDATWPGILRHLNPENDPQIRTLLLELRQAQAAEPRQVLDTIEAVCMASKPESEWLSRADLLERAKSALRGKGPM
jgi:hypothetical protein